MNKIDWKRKLSSRKLWAAIAGIVAGLAMVFGLDESTISTVAGAVVSAASVVAYIMGEAKADAAGATTGMVEMLMDALKPAQDIFPHSSDTISIKNEGNGNGNN